MNMLFKMCLFIQVRLAVHDLWTSVQGQVRYELGLVQPCFCPPFRNVRLQEQLIFLF